MHHYVVARKAWVFGMLVVTHLDRSAVYFVGMRSYYVNSCAFVKSEVEPNVKQYTCPEAQLPSIEV